MYNFEQVDDHKKSFKKACTKVGFFLIMFTIFIYVFDVALILGVNAIFNDEFVFSSDYLREAFVFFYNFIPLMMYIENAVIQIFSLVASVFLTCVVFKLKLRDLLPSNTKTEWFENEKKPIIYIKFFSLVYILNLVTSIIMSTIDMIFESSGVNIPDVDFSFSKNNLANILVIFIATVVVAPLIEEFIFRGILLKMLSPYGVWFSAIITSFLFAILHGNIMQGVGAFFVGIVLSIITIKSGSVIPAIILHALNNFIPFLSSFIGNIGEGLLVAFSYGIIVFVIFGITLRTNERAYLKMNEPQTAILKTREALVVFFTNPVALLYVLYELYKLIEAFFIVN